MLTNYSRRLQDGGQGFDTNKINELRGYVQRCMDDHFPAGSRQGNWGITGLGGSKTDQKLLKLQYVQ
jgi:hypothetical protein